ncbi:MAG TPA: response regulator [Ktedonobacteraceae bacterium]|nr:response regulator [Ktedonobacteraceae bacterium]
MSPTILVIDDDESLLDLFRFVLEEEGFIVSTSKATLEEVADVEKINPGLIILDIRLGHRGDGLLFLQKLKNSIATSAIPIIICSAAADVVRGQEELLQQMGTPILHKPFDIEELISMVRVFVSPPPKV